jgi:glycerate-2-kinase
VLIRNHQTLATTPQRQIVLDLIEAALQSIQFKPSVEHQVKLEGDTLHIADKQYNLAEKQRIYLVGFGKGSAEVCHLIEHQLGSRLTAGWDIDVVDSPEFTTVQYTQGNHPVPSQVNLDYTKNVLDHLQQLTDKDLVLVVICGGGSALFEYPQHLPLDGIAKVNEALVKSGATIGEMNIVRKHLSAVKGGKLAQHLYPATVACLIFSDVPGNDLATIASGPTVKNSSTMDDVRQVLEQYHLDTSLNISENAFSETPSDDKYFANVDNILVVSNDGALQAMQDKAKEHNLESFVYSNKIQGDARSLGAELIQAAKPGQILLAGGESTIRITHTDGRGGRNQALALAALPHLPAGAVLASFASDGWDFYQLAGAIADQQTLQKAHTLGINPQDYLDQDNSFAFWDATGDGIDTGRLESNVADLMIVYLPQQST